MLTMVTLGVPERYGISVRHSHHYFTMATTAKVELSLSSGGRRRFVLFSWEFGFVKCENL